MSNRITEYLGFSFIVACSHGDCEVHCRRLPAASRTVATGDSVVPLSQEAGYYCSQLSELLLTGSLHLSAPYKFQKGLNTPRKIKSMNTCEYRNTDLGRLNFITDSSLTSHMKIKNMQAVFPIQATPSSDRRLDVIEVFSNLYHQWLGW